MKKKSAVVRSGRDGPGSSPSIPNLSMCVANARSWELNRSGLLLRAGRGDDRVNLRLMRRIDEQYLKDTILSAAAAWRPGWRARDGEEVNRKRVKSIDDHDGPGSDPSGASDDARGIGTTRSIPYLLRGVTIERPDQVWSTDVTYIPLRSAASCS